jgi:hypothetical protein
MLAPGGTMRGWLFGWSLLAACHPGAVASGPYAVINEVSPRSEDGPDWIEIYNGGTRDAPVDAVSFDDEVVILDEALAPGRFLVVDSPSGIAPSDDITLLLEDVVLSHVDGGDFGTLGDGVSFGRIPDAAGEFRPLARASPGRPNGTLAQYACGDGIVDVGEVCDGDSRQTCVALGFESGASTCDRCVERSLDGCVPFAAGVVLNEIADQDEAIELFNGGSDAVDVGGWSVVDREEASGDRAFVFPEGTTLAPGAFLVASQIAGQLVFGLDIPDTITLRDARGRVVDQHVLSVEGDGHEGAISEGRLPDGSDTWREMTATLGQTNAL